MIITTFHAPVIAAYTDVSVNQKGKKDYSTGTKKDIHLKVGKHNYREIDHKDPRVAAQLRIYRKHGAISFEEILACDVGGDRGNVEGLNNPLKLKGNPKKAAKKKFVAPNASPRSQRVPKTTRPKTSVIVEDSPSVERSRKTRKTDSDS